MRTLDIAKRLIDDGFYPPTVYWPQVVEECLMAEPTETEDKETLDHFAAALHAIAREIDADPALVKGAAHETLVGRIDATRAARQPDLRWRKQSSQTGTLNVLVPDDSTKRMFQRHQSCLRLSSTFRSIQAIMSLTSAKIGAERGSSAFPTVAVLAHAAPSPRSPTSAAASMS